MPREHNDAWMRIPPFDRLADALKDAPTTEPPATPGMVRLSIHLKGTEAIFVAEGEEETVEAKFRYKRRAGAWQLFRREGSRWVADGPPSERIGRLLEGIVVVMQGADPRVVFP